MKSCQMQIPSASCSSHGSQFLVGLVIVTLNSVRTFPPRRARPAHARTSTASFSRRTKTNHNNGGRSSAVMSLEVRITCEPRYTRRPSRLSAVNFRDDNEQPNCHAYPRKRGGTLGGHERFAATCPFSNTDVRLFGTSNSLTLVQFSEKILRTWFIGD